MPMTHQAHSTHSLFIPASTTHEGQTFTACVADVLLALDACRLCLSVHLGSTHFASFRFILLLLLLWYFSLSHSGFSAIQKTKALHAEMSNMLKKYITSGQRRVLHFAAVGSHELLHVVHTSFCGVIIQDDPWFSILLATDSPIPVQCTHEYHILAFLWHIGYKGRVSVSTNSKDVTGLFFVVSGLSSRVGLVFLYCSHHGQLLLEELLSQLV